jgi:hypothetical protein
MYVGDIYARSLPQTVQEDGGMEGAKVDDAAPLTSSKQVRLECIGLRAGSRLAQSSKPTPIDRSTYVTLV